MSKVIRTASNSKNTVYTFEILCNINKDGHSGESLKLCLDFYVMPVQKYYLAYLSMGWHRNLDHSINQRIDRPYIKL